MDNEALIESARNVPIEDVIARHGIKLKRSGQERIGPCPKCGGTDRFAINVAKGIFNCRGCGGKGDVIELVEFLDGVDFTAAVETLTGEAFEKSSRNGAHRAHGNGKPKLGKVVEAYSYQDEGGDELFQVTRHDPKDFRQRRADGNGGWIWNLTGVRLVPYRLPELIEAIASDRTIFIVEGEKDVDNIHKLGAPATCNPRGAGKWGACQIDEFFSDANIVIIADNDPQSTNKKTGQLLSHEDGRPRFVGWDHAIEVAQHLSDVAESVRVIDLKKIWPQCPDKGDISDWIEAGGSIEALYDIAEQTPLWDGDVEREIAIVVEALKFVNIIAPLVARGWFIRDLIPLFNVTLFSGEGAIGKSIALLQLSVACVLGKPWLTTEPLKGPVLYVAAEEDEDEIRRRLEAIVTHPIYSGSRQALEKDLHILCFAGENALLAEPDRNDLMRPTKLFERIKAEAIALQPKLIVIDPVADVFGGRENDRTQTRMFVTMMRGLAIAASAAVILSSHPSVAGMRDDTGLSGSTAWHNSVRARAFFKKAPDSEPGMRLLEIKKNNYGPESKSITVIWDSGLYRIPLKPSEQERQGRDNVIDKLFVDLVKRFEKQGRNVCDNKNAPNYAPTAFHKLEEIRRKNIVKPELIQSLERLFNSGKIRVVTDGPPSKKRSRIVASNLPSNLPSESIPTPSNLPPPDAYLDELEEEQNPKKDPSNSLFSDSKISNDFNVPTNPSDSPTSGRTDPDADARTGGRRVNPSGARESAREGSWKPEGWKQGRKAGPADPEATVGTMPFMITLDTKRRLRERGYSDEQISELTPQQAIEILAKD